MRTRAVMWNLVQLLGLFACAAATALVFTRISERRASAMPRTDLAVDEWRATVGDGMVLHAGSGDTVVVFTDFECPYCRRLAGTLERLTSDRRHAPHVILRNFPLHAIHEHAAGAALGAVCAAAQGALLSYHDLVFARQAELGLVSWTAMAQAADVPDTAVFATCMTSPAASAAVAIDIALGNRLRITGTPAVAVNGTLVQGAPDERQLAHLLRARGRPD